MNSLVLRRTFSISIRLLGGERWRVERGLPTHRNDYGPLTDMPDWSYADGKPGKLGKGQIIRLKKNEEMAKRVMESLTELDAALGLKKQQDAEIKLANEKLLQSKLKQKCDNSSTDYRHPVRDNSQQSVKSSLIKNALGKTKK